MLPQVVRRSPEKAQVDLQTPNGIVFWTLRTLKNQGFLMRQYNKVFAKISFRAQERQIGPKLAQVEPKLGSF